MENDVLGEVIEAEREIQRCIELESKKAREWLDAVKKEMREEFSRTEQELRSRVEERERDAERKATLRAEETVKEAGIRAAGLRAADDGLLREIAKKYIIKILPG